MTTPFAPLAHPIGFYPVVPSADWVERLLSWGVRTVQLRIKAADHTAADISAQVIAAIEAGKAVPGAQVFINDHWQQALAAGAYGVHLGQEDLDTADLEALRVAGIRLGLSTHTPAELARAKAVQPSYLAIGPIYPTTLKVMPYEPVGLAQLAQWAQHAAPYPVVAIGGISLERLPGVLACGVDGVAVVSAVTLAVDPRQATLDGLKIAQKS
jgi:thiamine-phosphate pyrophosphorylase/hydroxymethylpyrimidine kinase/phosphomethylpyrimidine kinase/thiamine-phosphate diphosphorylase